jgi:hypothetical protein
MYKILAIISLFAVTGCASITGSKLQPVSIQTIQDDVEVAGIGCTLTNDAGKWFVTTPGSVTVQKSTDDLSIDCTKEGVATGHATAVSKSNAGVWGNIIAGGGIGYIVDRSTGAGFDYPNLIKVVLHKVGVAVGLTAPVATPAVAAAATPASAETLAKK